MSLNFIFRLRNSLCSVSRNKLDDMSRMQVPLFFIRNSSDKKDDAGIPKNAIGHIYSAASQPANGKVYDRKPFKMRLVPKKNYMWCLCGNSKSQPICDGSHNWPQYKCNLKPIKFQVEEEGDYWLCNCKQTKLRPFCDGTHKTL